MPDALIIPPADDAPLEEWRKLYLKPLSAKIRTRAMGDCSTDAWLNDWLKAERAAEPVREEAPNYKSHGARHWDKTLGDGIE